MLIDMEGQSSRDDLLAEMKELFTEVIREYSEHVIYPPHCNPVSVYQLLCNMSASLYRKDVTSSSIVSGTHSGSNLLSTVTVSCPGQVWSTCQRYTAHHMLFFLSHLILWF